MGQVVIKLDDVISGDILNQWFDLQEVDEDSDWRRKKSFLYRNFYKSHINLAMKKSKTVSSLIGCEIEF